MGQKITCFCVSRRHNNHAYYSLCGSFMLNTKVKGWTWTQVLQGDDNQTCPSEEHQERVRNTVKNHAQSLLRESVVPLLQDYSCGGSTGWRRVAYLDMSDPSQQCPSAWREITTPHRTCGRRYNSSGGDCQGLTCTTGNRQYDQVCGRIISYQSEDIPHAALPVCTV